MKTLFAVLVIAFLLPSTAVQAALGPMNFTITLSEAVTVDTSGGTPTLALDVGGVAKTASYVSGSGTAALTFAYTPVAGDVDLDGIAVVSPLALNGGTIRDAIGNDAALTFTPPDTSGVKINYPSLSMDFIADADGRYTMGGTAYDTLSALLAATGGSFTRSSIGTYTDASGALQTASANVPRFDYDPVTHVARGLLMEESKTNNAIGTFSAESATLVNANSTDLSSLGAGIPVYKFTHSGNAGDNQFSLNTSKSPGATTGDLLQISFYFQASFSPVFNIVYTGSAATSGAFFSNGTTQTFNIGTVSSSVFNSTWTRYVIPLTFSNGNGNPLTKLRVRISGGSPGDNFYVTAPQVEQAAFSSSYIPTAGAIVTRPTDTLLLPTGSWFNAAGTTAYVQADYAGGFSGVFALNSSSAPTNERIDLRAWQNQAILRAGGANTSLGISYPLNTSVKVAMASSASVAAASRNGASPVTGTPRLPSGINRLFIGNIDNGGAPLSGHISQFKYYPTAIANAQLQLLSQ